jgi:DNA-directed RNA polymerase I, II, and III subunit RPABC2
MTIERTGDDRITPAFLTKYERARLLGTRAVCISFNSQTNIKDLNETDALQISTKELEKKILPLKIRRYLPDGSFEDWKIDELEI